jgi:hypothetical protein
MRSAFIRLAWAGALAALIGMLTFAPGSARTASAAEWSSGRPDLVRTVGQENGEKVTICHRTGSDSNPYVEITISVNAWENNGHGDHDGDFVLTQGDCPETVSTTTTTSSNLATSNETSANLTSSGTTSVLAVSGGFLAISGDGTQQFIASPVGMTSVFAVPGGFVAINADGSQQFIASPAGTASVMPVGSATMPGLVGTNPVTTAVSPAVQGEGGVVTAAPAPAATGSGGFLSSEGSRANYALIFAAILMAALTASARNATLTRR